MAVNNSKNPSEEFSFENINQFRETIYKTMELYGYTSRSIDLKLVEANDELAMQVFLYGADFADYVHEQGLIIDADDLDAMREGLDHIQDHLSSEVLSFVAKHYEDCLSIYHCGFLFMKGVFKEGGNGENLPDEMKNTVDRIIKQDKVKSEFIAFEERCFHKAIEMQVQDKTVLDFLEKHLQEAYYLIRKGRYWWINKEHVDAKDEKLLNDHIRNEYFRLVMMDPLMQRSIIIEENKEVGLLLFKIGITVSSFLPPLS